MSDFDYEDLLIVLEQKLDNISNRERWTLPPPDIMIEGSNNISEIFLKLFHIWIEIPFTYSNIY